MMENSFGEAFILRHVLGVVGRVVAVDRETDRAVVDAHPVTHLAAEQLVHREPGGFPGNIPERHLDRADRAPPRFETAALANLAHHPLDVGRVFADQRRFEVQDVPGQVRLVRFDLGVAVDTVVGDDPHHRVLPDHRALEIDDFHRDVVPGYRAAAWPRWLDYPIGRRNIMPSAGFMPKRS